jgi:hypothetical protein
MWMTGGRSRPGARQHRRNFTAVCLEFLPLFEDFPSNSLEIQRFGRVWREGNGTAKTSYGLDWAV